MVVTCVDGERERTYVRACACVLLKGREKMYCTLCVCMRYWRGLKGTKPGCDDLAGSV